MRREKRTYESEEMGKGKEAINLVTSTHLHALTDLGCPSGSIRTADLAVLMMYCEDDACSNMRITISK